MTLANQNKGTLYGRVAVVTGAGAGLGRAYAIDLAKRGARVVVNDAGVGIDGAGTSTTPAERVAEELREADSEAVANSDSVADREGVDRLFGVAHETFGRVDILVNNAGIVRSESIAAMRPDDWDAVINVHLRGTFLCTQAALRSMHARATGGRIINITSGAGFATAYAGTGNYAAAKAGIIAFTRVVATEECAAGITCNAVAPLARTRLSATFLAGDTAPSLEPEAVAPFVSFLASDAARGITGQLFRVVRGGVELIGPQAVETVAVNLAGVDADALARRIEEVRTKLTTD